MNKKKENFGSVSIVERLISNDNTRAAIRTDLKDWCNSKNSYEICQNAIHSGRYYKNKKKNVALVLIIVVISMVALVQEILHSKIGVK